MRLVSRWSGRVRERYVVPVLVQTATFNERVAPLRQLAARVKRSARLLDVTSMTMEAQTTSTENRTSQWWPSKYGADAQAGVPEPAEG